MPPLPPLPNLDDDDRGKKLSTDVKKLDRIPLPVGERESKHSKGKTRLRSAVTTEEREPLGSAWPWDGVVTRRKGSNPIALALCISLFLCSSLFLLITHTFVVLFDGLSEMLHLSHVAVSFASLLNPDSAFSVPSNIWMRQGPRGEKHLLPDPFLLSPCCVVVRVNFSYFQSSFPHPTCWWCLIWSFSFIHSFSYYFCPRQNLQFCRRL